MLLQSFLCCCSKKELHYIPEFQSKNEDKLMKLALNLKLVSSNIVAVERWEFLAANDSHQLTQHLHSDSLNLP